MFYLLILGTGIWASMRSKKEEKKCTGDGMEITLLAGRNINLLVGIFTLTGKAEGGSSVQTLLINLSLSDLVLTLNVEIIYVCRKKLGDNGAHMSKCLFDVHAVLGMHKLLWCICHDSL